MIDEDSNVLMYERSHEGATYAVVLNFSNKPRTINLPYAECRLVLSTNVSKVSKTLKNGRVKLRPNEGVIIHV